MWQGPGATRAGARSAPHVGHRDPATVSRPHPQGCRADGQPCADGEFGPTGVRGTWSSRTAGPGGGVRRPRSRHGVPLPECAPSSRPPCRRPHHEGGRTPARIPQGAVKTRAHRAKAHLRASLIKNVDHEHAPRVARGPAGLGDRDGRRSRVGLGRAARRPLPACQAASPTSCDAHGSACRCRRAAAEAGPPPVPLPPDLALVWTAVRDEIECRALRPSSGSSSVWACPRDAMLVASAPALRGSSICAVALAVAFAVGGAGCHTERHLFLTVARRSGARRREASVPGGPRSSRRRGPYTLVPLVLLRTGAVLLPALPVVLVGHSPARLAAWAWLLPALGFTAAVLGLSTWFGRGGRRPRSPRPGRRHRCRQPARHRLGGLRPRYVVLYLLMLVLGPLVLVLRARRLGTIGRISP